MGFVEPFEIPPSGAVFTFGRSRFAGNEPSQFFIRSDPVVYIACGDEHTVLVCEGGRAFAFGSNDSGQLGLGHNRPVEKPMCMKNVKAWHLLTAACGKNHTLLASRCGKVFACGANAEGQLGLGDREPRHSPVQVPIDLNGFTVVALSAGCLHSALLTDNGDIWTWGGNADGQCGIESSEVVLIPTLVTCQGEPASATSLVCGYYHTAFSREDGCWTMGEAENGKLGRDPDNNGGNSPQRTDMQIDSAIVQVAAGGSHTMVLTEDGKVYGFGSNWCGQIGAGSEQEFATATSVEVPSAVNHITCGESHSAFVTENGEVYTCGDVRHGKLCREGDGKMPGLVSVMSSYMIKAAACGGCHTMLLAWNREQPDTETALPPLKPRHSIVSAMRSESGEVNQEISLNGDIPEEESPYGELPEVEHNDDDNEEIEVVRNGIVINTVEEESEPSLDGKCEEEEPETPSEMERSKTATIDKPQSKVKKMVNVFRRKQKGSCEVGNQTASKACIIL